MHGRRHARRHWQTERVCQGATLPAAAHLPRAHYCTTSFSVIHANSCDFVAQIGAILADDSLPWKNACAVFSVVFIIFAFLESDERRVGWLIVAIGLLIAVTGEEWLLADGNVSFHACLRVHRTEIAPIA